MKQFRLWAVCCLAATVIGCAPAPTHDHAKLAAIAGETKAFLSFMAAHPKADPKADLYLMPISETMRSLGITAFHGTPDDGLYLVVDHFFTHEWGYFVPGHPEDFTASDSDDPSYTPLGEGVFWYEIEG